MFCKVSNQSELICLAHSKTLIATPRNDKKQPDNIYETLIKYSLEQISSFVKKSDKKKKHHLLVPRKKRRVSIIFTTLMVPQKKYLITLYRLANIDTREAKNIAIFGNNLRGTNAYYILLIFESFLCVLFLFRQKTMELTSVRCCRRLIVMDSRLHMNAV